MRIFLVIVLILFPSCAFSLELGLSTSGESISIDFWSQRDVAKRLGLYGRFVWDFEEYEDGTTVNVCSDGSVSGSSGSGTCSGHGGINYGKPAEFNRYGLILGPTYWLTERVRLHGGVIMGFYNSDVDIGEKDKLDFTDYGIDLGVSFSVFNIDGARLVLSFETEREQIFLGFSSPMWE